MSQQKEREFACFGGKLTIRYVSEQDFADYTLRQLELIREGAVCPTFPSPPPPPHQAPFPCAQNVDFTLFWPPIKSH